MTTRFGVVAALAIGAVACGGEAAPARKPPVHPIMNELHAQAQLATPVVPEKFKPLPASASKVTFARIAKSPEPGWNVPRQTQHVPRVGNERLVTFLASETNDDTMSLFSFDVSTGKSEVLLRQKDLIGEASATRSREEELRRERQRDRNEGVTQHLWAKKAKVLVLPHSGDIFVRDYVREPSGTVRRLTKTPDAEIDPKPCDTGEKIAFVRKGELFSIDVATGKETALTVAAGKDSEGVTHGLSDFVGQEELGESSGFFWSPKCDRIAYLEVDERPVDKLPILGYRGEPDLMMQRYPRSGTKNPLVRAGIVDLATKKTTWVRLPKEMMAGERYLGRFAWEQDGSALWVQSLTRDQKTLRLLKVDPKSGDGTQVLSQTTGKWMHFSPFRALKDKTFLFTSMPDEMYRDIEVRKSTDGAVVKTIVHGEVDVDSIAAIDEEGGRVVFGGVSTKVGGSLERHLYEASLSTGKSVVALTKDRGVHNTKVDESGTTWVDVHSAGDRPPRAIVMKGTAKQSEQAGELPLARDPEIESLGLRPVQYVTVKAADGTTELQGALLTPRKIEGKHPVIVMVYGGPESQAVYDSWSPKLLWQHLADRGFVVFQLDNRGTGGKGAKFAQQVHKQLGKIELEDQIAGAKWLAAQPYVDAGRIGIYGHSYGGFMAALAMLDGKGAFAAGVAGSPVTDWRLYDTGYTERFMETPSTNAAGYEGADLSKKAASLSGKLLLTHALMDENVHYSNTAKLVDALIAANKKFELFVLPGERHGLRAPAARAYMPERVVTFFADNL